MEIIIGLLIIAIGAFCQSSCYVPINKIKDWSWESYWIVQGVFAWLVFPLLGALLSVPAGHSFMEIFNAPSFNIWMTVFFGVLWGVGGLTFGLSMRYLGVALGQSIALGTCAGLGTIMGPVLLNIFFPELNPLQSLTAAVLIGVAVTLLGIAIIGVAGSMKAASLSEEEKKAAVKDFNFPKGIAIALLAGFMSGCFNVGLEFGKEIFIPGTQDMFKTLPATLLVTVGGFLTNAVYCFYQNQKNNTWADYSKGSVWGNNLVFFGRCAVVQPVLRTVAGQGLPYLVAHAHHAGVLHPHGAQCGVLECVGHHPQGVEGLLKQDYRRAHHGHHRADRLFVPSPAAVR